MREPDIRLSAAERATFESLERQLTAPTARRAWVGRRHPPWSAAVAAVGAALLIVGLVAPAPLVGAAGFAIVAFGLTRATRRLTWSWALVRWRHRSSSAPEHMWEP